MKMNKRQLVVVATAALMACGSAFAQAKKEVTFAHQDMLVPLRTVMESGELEKATGYKINWRMFGGGGDVIKAMARGDVQLGEAGSSPIAAAASQGQDIKLFWILDDIADAEALIVRNGSGINSVKDLKGKKVATPFVSTAHYQLMAVHEARRRRRQERQRDEPAPARDRRRLGARRHRRRLHLGPGAVQDQGQRQGDRHLQDHRRQGFPDLRRPDRQRQVGGRERGLHGGAGQGAGQGRRRPTAPTRPSGPPTRPR